MEEIGTLNLDKAVSDWDRYFAELSRRNIGRTLQEASREFVPLMS